MGSKFFSSSHSQIQQNKLGTNIEREVSATSVVTLRNKSTLLLSDGGKLKDWLRGFPFVPERVNYFRDFSDGTKVKDMICQIMPNIKVNQKMVLPSENIKVKRKNWNYLYESVFPQIGLRLPNDMAEKMLDGKPDNMETILLKLMSKLDVQTNRSQQKPNATSTDRRANSSLPQPTQNSPPAAIPSALKLGTTSRSPVQKLSASKPYTSPRVRLLQAPNQKMQYPDWVTRFPCTLPSPGGYLSSVLKALVKSRQVPPQSPPLQPVTSPSVRKQLLSDLSKKDSTIQSLETALYAVAQQSACLERLLQARNKRKYLLRHSNDSVFRG